MEIGQCQTPERLKKSVLEYTVPDAVQNKHNKELQLWLDNEWLLPYPESELCPPKGLIPLMAVAQVNKHKVQSVLDYRELNDFVEVFTADMDVCPQKLREWWQ